MWKDKHVSIWEEILFLQICEVDKNKATEEAENMRVETQKNGAQ